MACNSCGQAQFIPSRTPQKSVVKNLFDAASQQPDKIKWFKDGVTGIFKCLVGDVKYSDANIISNRDICRQCPHSTKTDGKLTKKSQCAAIDPKTNAPCMCIILCKTQSGDCPLKKWTPLTIHGH